MKISFEDFVYKSNKIVMDPYEELIAEHDSVLYNNIKEYVPLMPDFRPQETIRMMRGTYIDEEFLPEPQDHWRLLYNELLALSEEESYQALVDAINSGEEEQIQPFLNKERFLSDFMFSYPALTWLMMKVSPEKTIIPILLRTGKYLDEIPIKRDYIKYIVDEEIVKILIEEWPFLLRQEDSDLIGYLGEIYWYKTLYPSSFEENKEKILMNVAKVEDLSAILFMLSLGEFSEATLFRVLLVVLDKKTSSDNEENILHILPRLDYDNLLGRNMWRTQHVIGKLINHSYANALKEFLSRSKFPKNSGILPKASIPTIPILKVLLEDGRFDSDLFHIIRKTEDIEIINFLLSYNNSFTKWFIMGLLYHFIKTENHPFIEALIYNKIIDLNRLIEKASFEGDIGVLEVLLQYPLIDRKRLLHAYFLWAVKRKEIEKILYLLEYEELDPSANNNEALRIVISLHKPRLSRLDFSNVIDILRSDPRVAAKE